MDASTTLGMFVFASLFAILLLIALNLYYYNILLRRRAATFDAIDRLDSQANELLDRICSELGSESISASDIKRIHADKQLNKAVERLCYLFEQFAIRVRCSVYDYGSVATVGDPRGFGGSFVVRIFDQLHEYVISIRINRAENAFIDWQNLVERLR
jgi:hypothetical protein